MLAKNNSDSTCLNLLDLTCPNLNWPFLIKQNFGSKNYWVRKNFGSRIDLRPKKFPTLPVWLDQSQLCLTCHNFFLKLLSVFKTQTKFDLQELNFGKICLMTLFRRHGNSHWDLISKVLFSLNPYSIYSQWGLHTKY